MAYRHTHSPLQSDSPVRSQNNRGNTENKQAEKGSWLKQVGKSSRVEKVKSDRQRVGGGSEKTKRVWWEGERNEKRFKIDLITYDDKPTIRVR
jgi:hypothetical protein